MDFKKYIRDVEDFPKKWIIFKDISPLLENSDTFKASIDEIALKLTNINKIAWLDARWFIFWAALAYKLSIPFVMIRKTGKLPSDVITKKYDLEYGSASFDIHTESISVWDNVAIIDDLFATWWTAKAACELIEELWANVESLNFIVNLTFLNWNKKLKWYKINSLVEY